MHRDICFKTHLFNYPARLVFFLVTGCHFFFDKPRMCWVSQCLSRISKESKVLWFRVFLFLSYMHAGAFVFMLIERQATEKQMDGNKIRMEILKNSTTSKYNMTEDQFAKLIDALKPSLCSSLPEWSYNHATSFTLQLLTTIGRSGSTCICSYATSLSILTKLFGYLNTLVYIWRQLIYF